MRYVQSLKGRLAGSLVLGGALGLLGAGPQAAWAEDCGTTTVIYDLFDQSQEELFQNGPETKGPRRLVTQMLSRISGRQSQRLIQTTTSDVDGLKLVIQPQPLAAKANSHATTFVVCKTSEQGLVSKLEEFTLSGAQPLTKQLKGLKDHRLSVRLVGQADQGSSEYLIDLQRPSGEGQVWQPQRQAPGVPVAGFADLHVHQASELAFAGGWIWGSHKEGPLSERLPACDGRSHATMGFLGPNSEALVAPHTGHTHGYPDFADWPSWKDIKHQQVAAPWLEQAHRQGLNLMVASAVNNQWLSAAMIAAGVGNKRFSPSDMESAKRQLRAFQQMAEHNPWYAVVRDPWEARRAIAAGKLAVVMAVEVSDLMPESDGPWKQQLYDLYDMGVRSVQIAHQTNNRFAGAAFHRDVFIPLSRLKARFEPNVQFASEGDGVHNAVGLSAEGYALLDEMVRLNMLIDITHLSLASQRQIYEYIAKKHSYYPLFNSHTRMDDLLLPDHKAELKEFVTTPETLAFVRKTGGQLGLRTGEEAMQTFKEGTVANNCDGSLRSWLQFYQYADAQKVKLAFASDFNGFITQMVPRFGPEACFNAPDEQSRQAQIAAQGVAPRNVSPLLKEFHQKGLAHMGLLPAVVEDMKLLGADTRTLENSAEGFLQMWERTYDPKRQALP